METTFGILALIGLALLAALYFLPTIIAALGGKRKTAAIFLLNLLLGWTLLGWVGSLVWAIADERAGAPSYPPRDFDAVPSPAATRGAAVPLAGPSTWRPLPSPGQRVHLVANRILRVEPAMTAMSPSSTRAAVGCGCVPMMASRAGSSCRTRRGGRDRAGEWAIVGAFVTFSQVVRGVLPSH
jgi:hypothetical protein